MLASVIFIFINRNTVQYPIMPWINIKDRGKNGTTEKSEDSTVYNEQQNEEDQFTRRLDQSLGSWTEEKREMASSVYEETEELEKFEEATYGKEPYNLK